MVVCGAIENNQSTLSTPTGNSISYTLQQFQVADSTQSPVYLWTGTDAAGGSNWTLSVTLVGTAVKYGFACLVFRSSNGVGTSNLATVTGGNSTVSFTTTGANSAIVTIVTDWNAVDGSSRVWRTVNSITPTTGNGLETTYAFETPNYTIYGAYYNDAGAIGSKTMGVSSPGSGNFTTAAVEILGGAGGGGGTYTTFSWTSF